MDWIGPLAVLALVDSTSFGTLLIPLWLMLAPRTRSGRIVLYLATVAAAYLLLGILIFAGVTAAADAVADGLASRPGQILRLGAGLVLLVLGLTIEPLTKEGKRKRAVKREQRIAERGPTRWQRWRAAVTDDDTAPTALVVLALTAVAIEAASMVPYLAAMGILSTAGLSFSASAGVLAAYCLVMIAPALVLLGARLALQERIAPALARFEGWLTRSSREAAAWVLFLLGAWLAAGAADQLGLF